MADVSSLLVRSLVSSDVSPDGVLQLNLQRCRTADQLLSQIAVQKKPDILLLSERYADKQSPSWFSDATDTAAVWVFSPGKVPILGQGEGNGFVKPNQSIADYRRMIDSLEDEIRNTTGGSLLLEIIKPER